jgi:hypothetical protein
MNVRRLTALLVLVAFHASPQTLKRRSARPVVDSPVGHWAAEHTSMGGIGSWWDFRADRTFTMYIGAMVTSPYTHSGNTITLPPATADGKGGPSTIRFAGDKLYIKSAGEPEMSFTRMDAAPSATDLLLGKWRPDPPAAPSDDPQVAMMQRLAPNARYVFSPNGTVSLRIPFTKKEGAWNASAHTFRFKSDTRAYSMALADGKLVLGQPPNNVKTDTYVSDPIQ